MQPKRIGIDTETLGIGPRALIFAIGAHVVGTNDGFHEWVDPEQELQAMKVYDGNVEYPFTYEEATVRWHKSANLFNWLSYCKKSVAHEGASIQQMLIDFITWVQDQKALCLPGQGIEIWVRGPDFDITKLNYHFDVYKLKAPWSYKDVRDVRTLDALIETNLATPSNKHDAYADARHQSHLIEKAIGKLNNWKRPGIQNSETYQDRPAEQSDSSDSTIYNTTILCDPE